MEAAVATAWRSDPLAVRCPHCGQANEMATSFTGHSALESLREPNVELVLICSKCAGVWLHTNSSDREITPEEWLDYPAEVRGEIQRQVKLVTAWRARRAHGRHNLPDA